MGWDQRKGHQDHSRPSEGRRWDHFVSRRNPHPRWEGLLPGSSGGGGHGGVEIRRPGGCRPGCSAPSRPSADTTDFRAPAPWLSAWGLRSGLMLKSPKPRRRRAPRVKELYQKVANDIMGAIQRLERPVAPIGDHASRPRLSVYIRQPSHETQPRS